MAEQRKYREYKLCNGLLDMNLKRIKLFFALVTVLSAMIPVSAQKLTYSIIKEAYFFKASFRKFCMDYLMQRI